MKCVVLGAGSWGTAVANVLADNGHDVTLWTRESSVLFEVRESYRNSRYLPGIELNHNLKITDDLKVCKETDTAHYCFWYSISCYSRNMSQLATFDCK